VRAAFGRAVETRRGDDALSVLASALSRCHFLRGRYSLAEDVIRETLALEPTAIESALLWDRLARVLRLQGRPQEALAAFRSAEQALDALPERGESWWEHWLDLKLDEATFFYFENHQDELAEVIEQVGPLVEARGTPAQGLELLHLRGQQAYRQERYALSDQTEELVRETYGRALAQDDVSAEFTLGFCLLWRGKPGEAEEHLARGRVAARARGVALIETRSLVYGVIARRRQNDVEGARAWLRELEEQEELHGYRGLTAACGAWVAYRDGDLERALTRGAEALVDWSSEGRRGSSAFEWAARFPLLGVELERGCIEDAEAHARAMLDEAQQPLPPEISDALERAVVENRHASYAHAIELARPGGYA
jgi:tetratricopeptide (TPR) repeat protein